MLDEVADLDERRTAAARRRCAAHRVDRGPRARPRARSSWPTPSTSAIPPAVATSGSARRRQASSPCARRDRAQQPDVVASWQSQHGPGQSRRMELGASSVDRRPPRSGPGSAARTGSPRQVDEVGDVAGDDRQLVLDDAHDRDRADQALRVGVLRLAEQRRRRRSARRSRRHTSPRPGRTSRRPRRGRG